MKNEKWNKRPADNFLTPSAKKKIVSNLCLNLPPKASKIARRAPFPFLIYNFSFLVFHFEVSLKNAL